MKQMRIYSDPKLNAQKMEKRIQYISNPWNKRTMKIKLFEYKVSIFS